MADVRLTRTFTQVMVPVSTSGLDIRLTRTFTQVMVPVSTSGLDIRLTRTFAQVMVPVFTGLVFATDDLGLTETVIMTSNYGPGEDDLTFTETVVEFGPHPVDAADTLAFTGLATTTGPWLVGAIENPLNFSDEAQTTGPWLVDAADTLTLSDLAPEPGGPFLKDADDALSISDVTTVDGGARDVASTDSLSLSEDVGVIGGDFSVSASDKLGHPFYGLSDEVAQVVGGELELSASDNLSLSESITVVGGELAVSTDDTITFAEDDFETAGGARDFFAADTLSLTGLVVEFGPYYVDASDTIGLTETIVDGGDIRQPVIIDSITFSETVEDIECVDDTLSLTEEALSDDGVVAEDTLALTDEATATKEVCTDTTESLALTDSVVDSWEWCTEVTESLTVTEEDYFIGDPGSLEDVDVGLRETAEAGGNINVTITEALSWFELTNNWIIPAAGAIETATDTLSLTDSALEPVEASAKDTIGFADSAEATVCYPATDSIEFTDVATANGDFNVTASDTFTFSESFSSILSDSTCEYDESQAGAYPADTALSFRLVGVGSWSVRAPRFNNKDVFSPHRVVNESRGGTLLITSQPEWPEVEVLKMDFSVLKKQEGLDLQDFLSNNLGQVITLTDWEGRAWTGVVTDTNLPLTELGTDNFAIGFEFEGTKV